MIAKMNSVFEWKPLMTRSMVVLSCLFTHLVYKYNNNTMGRIAGQSNILTTEVKDKSQTILDEVVSQFDHNSMTTDQKIKMLQMGLQYLLLKLKYESNEIDVLDTPLFIDIISRDEENGGWETERKSLPIKD
tara:strand:+ start:141 stop:536 length:396 start_codon:yes stop_codon:yes gene_type:complete